MSKVLDSNIHLRIAELADCDKVFEWRNHPSVRKFSADSNELDYASHKQWFKRVLSDENYVLLIAVQGEEDVGVIRYNLDEANRHANINIYVRPEVQGQGIGREMMRAGEAWLRQNKPFVKKIIATVSRENHMSLRLFQKAGFSSKFLIFSKNL